MRWKLIGLTAIAVFIIAVFAASIFLRKSPHPSDQQMIAEFSREQPDLRELLSMIKSEPQITRIADDFIWIDGAKTPDASERPKYLSDARWEQYRQLFRRLHITEVGEGDDGSVSFVRSNEGMAVAGWSKEFLWSKAAIPHPLPIDSRESVEIACIGRNDGCYNYKRLAPDWFIEFENN